MKNRNKGIFIVFEGIDGSGKSLQTKKTISWLKERGVEVIGLVEPTHGKWGTQLREVLSGGAPAITPEEELDLFMRDRRDNIMNNIIPAVESGTIVVQDRYYYSTLAYQGARGIDVEEIREKHRTFIIEPDLVFILDLPPEEGLRRIKDKRGSELSIFEKQSYLAVVKRIYDSFSGTNIFHIDASRNPDTIQNEIRQRIGLRLRKGHDAPA